MVVNIPFLKLVPCLHFVLVHCYFSIILFKLFLVFSYLHNLYRVKHRIIWMVQFHRKEIIVQILKDALYIYISANIRSRITRMDRTSLQLFSPIITITACAFPQWWMRACKPCSWNTVCHTHWNQPLLKHINYYLIVHQLPALSVKIQETSKCHWIKFFLCKEKFNDIYLLHFLC